MSKSSSKDVEKILQFYHNYFKFKAATLQLTWYSAYSGRYGIKFGECRRRTGYYLRAETWRIICWSKWIEIKEKEYNVKRRSSDGEIIEVLGVEGVAKDIVAKFECKYAIRIKYEHWLVNSLSLKRWQ